MQHVPTRLVYQLHPTLALRATTHDISLASTQNLFRPRLQVVHLVLHRPGKLTPFDGRQDPQHPLCRPSVSGSPQPRILRSGTKEDMLP